jgi:LuxR family maltose regulon positive regulatory protein
MHSPATTRALVLDETLIYQRNGRQITITVGSPAWYTWLQDATAFTFKNDEGHFSAHKARSSNRRGSWYWYAYRRQRGHLFNLYLGTAEKLTVQHLHEATHELALRADPSMVEIPSASLPPAAERPLTSNDDPLLTTRLHIPHLPAQHISRPRLLMLLEQSTQRPVTLIFAPAGSGKTTLLAEWAAATLWPVAWLSLEEYENDPTHFLSHLMEALISLDAHISITTRPTRSWQLSDYERALTNLLNDLAQLLQQDVALILDDAHLLTSEIVHELLRFLIDHLPARLHLLIGTHGDPPLPLARLRARNQLSELGIEDLRFLAPEIEAFGRAMDLTLPNEAINLLERRTEGWITGIQLLALALRGQPDATSFLRECSGTHRFLLDYVSEEVLGQQTPEAQRFLLRTSILDRLCGPLCDYVTDESSSQNLLTAFSQANLFLRKLDGTETWYCYHPLFTEALRAHLQTREPALIPELYLRASGWYEQRQELEEACEYAFRAGDLARAAKLLETLVPALLEQGKFLRLRGWLFQLSPEQRTASPRLSLATIWTRCHAGTPEKTIRQLEQQIQAHASDELAHSSWTDLRLVLILLQAATALSQNDLPRTLALVHEILAFHPRAEGPINRLISLNQTLMLGTAYRASGDLKAAEQIFFEIYTADSIDEDHSLNLLAAADLAELYETQGRLRKLERLCNDLFQRLAGRGEQWLPSLALMQIRYATLMYEWNRLDDAEASIQLVIGIARDLDQYLSIPMFALLSVWILARIELARGKDEQIWRELVPGALGFPRWQNPEQRGKVLEALPARLVPICEQAEQSHNWDETLERYLDTLPGSQLSSSNYFDYLAQVRALIKLERSQRNSPQLKQALLLLDHLHSIARKTGSNGWLLEIQTLIALVLQATGKTKQALTILGKALALAEPEGYLRIFVDEGQPMMLLLTRVAAYTSASTAYLQKLLAAMQPNHHAPTNQSQPMLYQPLLDPLSGRELEVLYLLAEGYSNQQIANRLVISLHTVKLHARHILAKLIVANRTQAVARARELRLL